MDPEFSDNSEGRGNMRILMFDIDTLRADHMGCYGYGRNTTPNMDRVAEEGVRFDRYYCPNAPCLPSRASLVSGQYGIHNGIVGHGGTAADMRLQGAKMILDWNDAMMKTSRYDVDPMWTVMREGGPEHCRGQLKDYMKRLEGTPREYGIKLLKEKYQADLE